MKEFKRSVLVLAVASSLSLAGCGGGSSSDSSESPNSSGGGTTTESQTITAIDGYLERADVYIDANDNGQFDEGEVKVGTTGTNGTLEISAEQFSQPLVVVAVENVTWDSDSGLVDTPFSLSAEAGSDYVTPFTDLAKKTGKSISELAQELGVDAAILAGDYIKAKSDAAQAEEAGVVHALARFVVAEAKQATDISTVASNLGAAKSEIVAQVKSGKNADDIELDLEDSGAIKTVEPTRLAFSKAALQDTNWSMFRFDDNGDNEQFYVRFGTANQANTVCINNETFVFLKGDETVAKPDDTCAAGSTFEVSANGKLILAGEDSDGAWRDEFTMLYRHTGDGIATYVMISDLGELLWMDSVNVLEDAGDFAIAEDVTYYMLSDDSATRDEVEYIVGKMSYTVAGAEPFTVGGEEQSLNLGNLEFGDLDGSFSGATSFRSVPLYTMKGWETSNNDILITVEEQSSDEDYEHWFFEYRKAGKLALMMDYKPSTNGESLFLQSESEMLIKELAAQVEARNSGQQGDQ